MGKWKSRLSAGVIAAMPVVGGAVLAGPASPASAASCTAQAKGGVNSNSSNWVSAKVYLCSGKVQARAVRLHGDTPPTYHLGVLDTSSTATTPTTGTRGGGGAYSNAWLPMKYIVHNYIDATWRNITFSW